MKKNCTHQLTSPIFLSMILLIMLLLGSFFPVRAATPTPKAQEKLEATSAAENDDSQAQQTIEEIRKRIEKNRSKVQGTIDDLLSKKRGFIGEIERVTGESLTVRSTDGTTIIPITNAVSISKDTEALAVDEVAVGNWAIVMGSVSSQNAIEPQFIEIFEDSLEPTPKAVLLGSITEMKRGEISLLARNSGEEKAITVSNDTTYQNSDGSEAELSDFSEQMNCLITGVITEDGIEASTIRSLAPLDTE